MSEFRGPEISKSRNGLGRRTPSADSIFGLVAGGVVTAGYTALGSIVNLESVNDAETLGFNASYDSNNGILVYHHIVRFFHYNPNGTLYLMLVAQGTTMTAICDTANTHLKKLLTADETNREIKYAGVVLNPDMATYVATYTSHLDADVATAIPKADELLKELYGQGIFVDGVMLEGRLDPTTTITNLYDLRALTNENVSVCIAADTAVRESDTDYAAYADIGSALGMLSVRKVSENIGSVDIANKPTAFRGQETYPLTSTARQYFLNASLSSGKKYSELTEAEKASLQSKGYIYAGKYEGLDGFFFNDSHTAIVSSDDYAYIEDNRVWGKAARLVRQALLPVMKGEVEIDPNTGFLPASQISYYEQKAQSRLRQMSADGEISGEATIIIEPNQDVVATGKITLQVQYVRRGILRKLEAEVGAINPATS